MIAAWEPEDIIRCKYTVPLGTRGTALSTGEVQPVNFSGLETQAMIAFSESRRDEQQQQQKKLSKNSESNKRVFEWTLYFFQH